MQSGNNNIHTTQWKYYVVQKNINIKNNVKPQIAITTPDKLLTLFERAFFKFVVLFMSMEKTPNVNMVFECCFTGKYYTI